MEIICNVNLNTNKQLQIITKLHNFSCIFKKTNTMTEQLLDDGFQTSHVTADKWKRFGALFIDNLVAMIPYYVLLFVAPKVAIFAYILFLAYFFIKDALFDGRSLGKKILGLRVIRTSDGSSIAGDYGKSALRNVSQIIPFVDAVLVLMGKERLGDGWAGTQVIEG